MRKALDRVYEGSCVIAALFVLGILVVVLLQVGATMLDKVMVWLTGEPIGWFVPSYAEFTGYFRGVSGWLALAFTFQAGNHIRVRSCCCSWFSLRWGSWRSGRGW